MVPSSTWFRAVRPAPVRDARPPGTQRRRGGPRRLTPTVGAELTDALRRDSAHLSRLPAHWLHEGRGIRSRAPRLETWPCSGWFGCEHDVHAREPRSGHGRRVRARRTSHGRLRSIAPRPSAPVAVPVASTRPSPRTPVAGHAPCRRASDRAPGRAAHEASCRAAAIAPITVAEGSLETTIVGRTGRRLASRSRMAGRNGSRGSSDAAIDDDQGRVDRGDDRREDKRDVVHGFVHNRQARPHRRWRPRRRPDRR